MRYFNLGFLFFIMLCYSCKTPNNSFLFGTNQEVRVFKIPLNESWSSNEGAPLKIVGLDAFYLPLREGKDHKAEEEGVTFTFTLEVDTIHFHYLDFTGLKMDGNFLVLPGPTVSYKILYNPMNFDAYITPEKYYEVRRNGAWVKNQNGKVDSLNHVNILNPMKWK